MRTRIAALLLLVTLTTAACTAPADVWPRLGPPELVFQVGLRSRLGHGVFLTSEPVAVRVSAQNRGPHPEKVHAAYRVTDVSGHEVTSGQDILYLPAGQQSVHMMELTGLSPGWFRIFFTLTDRSGDPLEIPLAAALLSDPFPRQPQASSPFVVHQPALSEPESALLRAIGAGLTLGALTATWRQLQPERGSFNWAEVDAAVTAVTQRGLIPVGSLDGPPDWSTLAGYNGAQNLPPDDLGDLAWISYELGRRYRSKVPYWTVWTGPNLPERFVGTPEHYTALHLIAYLLFKQGDPGVQVVSHVANADTGWLQEVLALGTAPYTDVLSYEIPLSILRASSRSYRTAMSLEIGRVQRLIDTYGGGIELWHVGSAAAGDAPLSVTPDDLLIQQAELMVRMHAVNMAAGVAKTVFTPLAGAGSGLVGPYHPHPALVAYHAMTRLLGETRFAGPLESGQPGAALLVFAARGKPIIVAWAEDPQGQSLQVVLPTTAASATLTDIMGGTHPLTPTGGALHLSLSASPVYISVDDPGLLAGALAAQAVRGGAYIRSLIGETWADLVPEDVAAAIFGYLDQGDQAAGRAARAAADGKGGEAGKAVEEALTAFQGYNQAALALVDSANPIHQRHGTALLHRGADLRATWAGLASLISRLGQTGDFVPQWLAARHVASGTIAAATEAIDSYENQRDSALVHARRLLTRANRTLQASEPPNDGYDGWALAGLATYQAALAHRLIGVETPLPIGTFVGTPYYLMEARRGSATPILARVFNTYAHTVEGQIDLDLPPGWTLLASRSTFSAPGGEMPFGALFSYTDVPFEVDIPPETEPGVYSLTFHGSHQGLALPPVTIYIKVKE